MFFRSSAALLFPLTLDFQDYPDYYQLIRSPIALAQIRKRSNSGYYKNAIAYRDDWRLMFNNARTYNQEGSWVYIDAEEMEKAFNAAFEKHIAGTDIPGAPAASAASTASYDSALTPMEEDERPPPSRSRSTTRKNQIVSDDEEYLTPSDDE